MSGVKIEQKVKVDKILGLLSGLIVAVASLIVFLYTNFQTVASAKDESEQRDKRLDRIESKVDILINRK